MNGFATTDELNRKDGESWMFRGTVLYCDVSAFTCLCMSLCGPAHMQMFVCTCMHVCMGVCVARGVVPFNLQNPMSYLNERYDTEKGGSCSVESPQQDC